MMCDRFKAHTLSCRKWAMERAGVTVFGPECIPHRPSHVSVDIWQRLCQYWMTNKFKVRSTSGKANREKHVVAHGGGSISFDEHLRRMKEKNNEVNEYDVYKKLYTGKDGKFRGEKAKQVADAYDSIVANKRTQEHEEDNIGVESTLVDSQCQGSNFDQDAWIKATGGMKKGRLVGFGTRAIQKSLIGNHSKLDVAASSEPIKDGNSEAQSQMKAQMFEELQVQMKEQIEKEIREKFERERKEYEEALQCKFDDFVKQFKPPPS